jgi:hypothetical protein
MLHLRRIGIMLHITLRSKPRNAYTNEKAGEAFLPSPARRTVL